MVKILLSFTGDSAFWQTPRSLKPAEWIRILSMALILAAASMRPLLNPDYQFVGNDLDLPGIWSWKFRFTRLWNSAGIEPWWNPYFQLGSANDYGPSHPLSLLSMAQYVFTSTNKGLDHTLLALFLIMSLTSVALLLRLGFSPISSLLGGLLLAGAGTAPTQLFAGHVALYASICLMPGLLLSFHFGIARAQLHSMFPAVLLTALLFMTGEGQGPYVSLWMCCVWLLANASMGNARVIPPPTLWTYQLGEIRCGNRLLATVDAKSRFLETLWVLMKLTFTIFLGAVLAMGIWVPTLASGNHWLRDGDIFQHSAPPICWLSVLIPHLFLGPGQNYNWTGWAHWEGQPGMGCASLVIILIGIKIHRDRDLLLPGFLLIIGALLAAGKYTPFLALYAVADPFIYEFEVPSRFYFAVNFAWVIAFAWCLDKITQTGWHLPRHVSRYVMRMAIFTALLWIGSYFLGGHSDLWQLFLNHLQFAYNYSGIPAVNPYEFYALTWTRFSAAAGLIGLLTYSLLRLPCRFRLPAVATLILLDTCRFSYPYLNMRPNHEFQVQGELFDIIREKQLTGKLLNNFQERTLASFALVRIEEWNFRLAGIRPDTNLLMVSANKAIPDFKPEHPNFLNRLLGVRLYYHPKTWLDDPAIREKYANDTSYTTTDALWTVTSDDQARPAVFISRNKQSVTLPFLMLQELKKQPQKCSDLWSFLDPATHTKLEQLIARGRWSRTPLQDRLTILSEDPLSLEIGCDLSLPALIVVNQSWSPDWTVTVDGFDSPCIPVQLGYNRAVLVDGGSHRVHFRYFPKLALESRRQSWIALISCILTMVALATARALTHKFSSGSPENG